MVIFANFLTQKRFSQKKGKNGLQGDTGTRQAWRQPQEETGTTVILDWCGRRLRQKVSGEVNNDNNQNVISSVLSL
jgi:hypothetical protein